MFYFVVIKDGNVASSVYMAVKVFMLAWPAFVIFYLARKNFPQFTRMKSTAVSLAISFLSGIAIFAFLYFSYGFLSELINPARDLIKAKAESYNLLDHFLVFSVVLSTFNALFEEYYWRWFVFRGLTVKFSAISSALISSAAFSVHHFVVLSQMFSLSVTLFFTFAVFCGGLIFCLLYKKTGNIVGSFFAHLCADAAIMAVAYGLMF